jgi:hypothetical protein
MQSDMQASLTPKHWLTAIYLRHESRTESLAVDQPIYGQKQAV